MRPALLPGFLLLVAACAPQPRIEDADALRRHADGMNLLVVFLDAAAASHFSYMGYHRETTPNIDAVAAESVVFRTAYAQASATPLSMYSMMTSRYPILEEEDLPASGELAAVIPPALPTLAGWASEKYPSRAAFVANRWLGEELGFDNGYSTFEKVYDQVEPGNPIPANLVTDGFATWLDTRPAGPWLTWLHYLEPHLPYTPPEPWLSRFAPELRGHTDGTARSLDGLREGKPDPEFIGNTVALYDGNLAWVDAEVGRMIEDLKRRGVWDKTILVLTSDHGEAFWEHGVRGHGFHVYEEFVRIPLIIRVPGLAPREVVEAVELIDVTPTLLDLAGVFVPAQGAAGQSLASVMVGETRSPDVAFMRNHKSGYLELAARRGPLKYHALVRENRPEFYNLDADPGETMNLLGTTDPAAPEILTLFAGMRQLLSDWVDAGSGTGDDFDPALTGADSLDQDTIEALRAIGYFGN